MTQVPPPKRHPYDQWSPDARALDLVGDKWTLLIIRDLSAGPRRFVELQRVLPGISAEQLRSRGVQIVPVAASGVEENAEYVMRTMAALTQGRYIFLTDDSGIGNSHLKPTIGQFEVELLNKLLVRVISERL